MFLKAVFLTAAFLVAEAVSWVLGDGGSMIRMVWPQSVPALIGHLFIVLGTVFFCRAVIETGASRVFRFVLMAFWGGAVLLVADAALAQDAAATAEPAMTWKDFFFGLWTVVYPYISGPAVVAFLMAQARPWFPWLGNLGIFTFIGDLVAGNYRLAKNAPK